jgi:hypothetical protein
LADRLVELDQHFHHLMMVEKHFIYQDGRRYQTLIKSLASVAD